MITNFEKYTKDLNKNEKRAMHIIADMLERETGTNRQMSSNEIIALMKPHYNLNPGRLRKIISVIVILDLVPLLISNGKGYYVTTDEKEIDSWMQSQQQRIDAMQCRLEAIKRQKEKYLGIDWSIKSEINNNNTYQTELFGT